MERVSLAPLQQRRRALRCVDNLRILMQILRCDDLPNDVAFRTGLARLSEEQLQQLDRILMESAF